MEKSAHPSLAVPPWLAAVVCLVFPVIEFSYAGVPADAFHAAISVAQGAPTLNCPSAGGLQYQVQQSTDLVHWTDYGATVVGTGGSLTTALPPPTANVFYRVQERDFFNGQPPLITVLSKSVDSIAPHSSTTHAITVQIASSGGVIGKAPVTVSLVNGDAQLSSNGGAMTSSATGFMTDSSGTVSISVKTGNSFTLNTVRIASGTAAPVDISFRAYGDYSGFYCYYEGDLEEFLATNIYGRLHSNAGVWIGTSNASELDVFADVSAQNGIHNGYVPADSGFLHPSPPNPYKIVPPARTDQLVASWLGMPAFNTNDINPNNDSPRELIETPIVGYSDPFQAIRLSNLATITILLNSTSGTSSVYLGQSYSRTTAPAPVSAAILAAMRPTAQINDYREGSYVKLTTFDVSVLLNAITTNYGPFNGIIYLADLATPDQTKKAIRFINGATLPNLATGLTLASPNGVYLQGGFNCGSSPYSDTSAGFANPPSTADVLGNDSYFQTYPVAAGYARKPVMIACDAFTCLSNNWVDANSTNNVNNRIATSTTMNLVVLTGNVPTNSGSYSGGVTGTIRLMESWAGKTLTFYGSVIAPFSSAAFNGLWMYASYQPPKRYWFYDPLFLTTPPPGLPPMQLTPTP